MASILDIGILDYFTPVFGENKGINSLIAFAIAFLFILTPDIIGIVKTMTPWFMILLIFLLMIVLLFMFVGVKEEGITKAFTEKSVVWVIIVLSIIIFAYAMTQVYGSQIQTIYAGENVTGPEPVTKQVGKIIFHPRILGVVLLLIIAAQAVRLITASITGK